MAGETALQASAFPGYRFDEVELPTGLRLREELLPQGLLTEFTGRIGVYLESIALKYKPPKQRCGQKRLQGLENACLAEVIEWWPLCTVDAL